MSCLRILAHDALSWASTGHLSWVTCTGSPVLGHLSLVTYPGSPVLGHLAWVARLGLLVLGHPFWVTCPMSSGGAIGIPLQENYLEAGTTFPGSPVLGHLGSRSNTFGGKLL